MWPNRRGAQCQIQLVLEAWELVVERCIDGEPSADAFFVDVEEYLKSSPMKKDALTDYVLRAVAKTSVDSSSALDT